MRQMGLSGVNPAAPAIRGKAYALARTRPGPQQHAVSCYSSTEDSTYSDAGRGPSMRRFGLIACLVALIAAGLTTTNASAALIAGIGDQNASTFSDANFK